MWCKGLGLWLQTKAQRTALSLTSCLASGKPHNFSVSQCLRLKSEESSAEIKRLKFSGSIGLRTSALELNAHFLPLTSYVILEKLFNLFPALV